MNEYPIIEQGVFKTPLTTPDNMRMKAFHELNQKRVLRRKSFELRSSPGANSLSIQLPGSARWLAGINLVDLTTDAGNLNTIIVNNDSVIEQVPSGAIARSQLDAGTGTAFQYSDGEFFQINIPLSGNDSISWQCNAITGGVIYIVFYYL